MTTTEMYVKHTETIIESFGRQVKIKRIEQGMQRRELSAKALLSYRSIASLERGEMQNVTVHVVAAISIALDFFEWDLIRIGRI